MPVARRIVTLREIDADSLTIVGRLAVAPDQERLVASNTWSIAQAYFEPAAWFRGIYAGDDAVGFAMLFDGSRARDSGHHGVCYLWRLMIDAAHQRHGYGSQAMALLIAHVRTLPDTHTFGLSFQPVPGNARDFYARFGFRETGRVEDGEIEMAMTVVPGAGGS